LNDNWQMAFSLHSQWNVMKSVTVEMTAIKLETYVSN